MEHISRMATEVNKLIGSNLIAGYGVYLTGIGSLFILTNAEGVKSVDFSSAEQGAPLEEIIKGRAECSAEQAAQIYSRWLEEVRTESLVVIEGVGELRNKSFVASESFLKQLNPKDTTVMESTQPTQKKSEPAVAEPKKKRSYKVLFIILFLIGLCAGIYWGVTSSKKARAEEARIEAIAKEKAAEQQRIADSIALAQIEARRLAEAEAAVVKAPRYRVVYGVYTLRSNVDVAIRRINTQYGESSANEYPFGSYTMVSMFESDDRDECQRFLMENYDAYPDSWIYDSEQ